MRIARNIRAITGFPSRVGMMKIKYEVFAIVVAATALCSDIRLPDAQTIDSDEQVNPLIYIVLDTSGSMNGSINDAEGNTRLTKALAELAGGVKIPAGQTKITKAVCPDTCDVVHPRVDIHTNSSKYPAMPESPDHRAHRILLAIQPQRSMLTIHSSITIIKVMELYMLISHR